MKCESLRGYHLRQDISCPVWGFFLMELCNTTIEVLKLFQKQYNANSKQVNTESPYCASSTI